MSIFWENIKNKKISAVPSTYVVLSWTAPRFYSALSRSHSEMQVSLKKSPIFENWELEDQKRDWIMQRVYAIKSRDTFLLRMLFGIAMSQFSVLMNFNIYAKN